MNKLFFGDNLEVLRERIPTDSVDLIYLDPPFNSNADYNVLFRESDGTHAAAQRQAFQDTWHWDNKAAEAFEDAMRSGGKVAEALIAFRTFLSESDLMAYLAIMAPRLTEMRRVMKPGGALYLHCDPTASHYLKVLLDGVFGSENFRSEVVWKRTNTHGDAKRWSPVHDTLLYYTNGQAATWNPQYEAHGDDYIAAKYRYDDGDGRLYQLDNMTSPKPRPNMMYEWRGHASPPNGWRYSRSTMERLHNEGRIWYPDSKNKRPRLKRYLGEMRGVLRGSVWTDISPLNSQAQEREGYPTQKPEALLDRIIKASSNEGDVVLDPFCGCGTLIASAHRLGRQWIGIDIAHVAIRVIRGRMLKWHGLELKPGRDIEGVPVSAQDAAQLAAEDPFRFQSWALDQVGIYGTEPRRGADRGIDGRLYFNDDAKGRSPKQIIISVKGGHVTVSHLRDLGHVVTREKAQIGVMISLNRPTAAMKREAAGAGFWESKWGTRHPRLQILTIDDLFAGKTIDYPRSAEDFKRSARPRRRYPTPRRAEQLDLSTMVEDPSIVPIANRKGARNDGSTSEDNRKSAKKQANR